MDGDLSQVDVELAVMVRYFDVFSFNQSLDSFVYDNGRRLETFIQLLHNLCDKLIVIELFPGLHDPHDAGFNLVFSVFIHLFPGFIPLGLCLALSRGSLKRYESLVKARDKAIYPERLQNVHPRIFIINYLLDLDPVELRGECLVDCEDVAGFDIFSLGRFLEDPLAGLAHGQRLQGPH